MYVRVRNYVMWIVWSKLRIGKVKCNRFVYGSV